jgi:GT2 family glycosyltransferase
MQAEYPLVSLITVNYISLKDTIEFLDTTTKLTYPNLEIIVVDNNSPKGKPTEELKNKYSHVTFIESEENLGFAGGNNLGIKAAKGKYYFLLNNDTLLFQDFLEPIVEFMESHPEVGIASPKVIYPDGKTIQFAGAAKISPYTGRGKRLGLMELDHGQYNNCYETGLGHGAALIVPKIVCSKVGLLPEVYFLYYEEHDWCEQIKRAGYKMYYIGTSKVIHKEAQTTGGDFSPLKVYYMTRNRILFMRRNSKGIHIILGMCFFFFFTTPKYFLSYLFKGKASLVAPYFRGVGWNLLNKPF